MDTISEQASIWSCSPQRQVNDMEAHGHIRVTTGNGRDTKYPICGIRCADVDMQDLTIESIIHRRPGDCGVALRLICTPV